MNETERQRERERERERPRGPPAAICQASSAQQAPSRASNSQPSGLGFRGFAVEGLGV